MQIRVRIEFEGMQRVESVKHEVGADSVMVAGLKRTIMNIGGIDIPMDVVSLYRDDSVAPVKELDDDEIVSGDGDTVFLWMRIPRPHVVYKMSLPGEQVLMGDIYVKKETINPCKKESHNSSDLPKHTSMLFLKRNHSTPRFNGINRNAQHNHKGDSK